MESKDFPLEDVLDLFFRAFGRARRLVVPGTTALVHRPSPLTLCNDFVSVSMRAAMLILPFLSALIFCPQEGQWK